jgi:hypothetical protein
MRMQVGETETTFGAVKDMECHVMQSKATTVEAYLKELPAERREAIGKVRQVIRKNLDKDYEEGMQYGMIGYFVPHKLYPAGYHCDPKQPLPFACLASQKNYMSLYLMTTYMAPDNWFKEAWAKTGKKLDMGKSCIRFTPVEDLALDVIGEAIRRMPAKKWIEVYESVVKGARKKSAANKTPVKKPAMKKPAKEKSKAAAGRGAKRR